MHVRRRCAQILVDLGGGDMTDANTLRKAKEHISDPAIAMAEGE